MRSTLLISFFLIASINVVAQKEKSIIKSRKENVPLQAVASLDASTKLFKGQEYTLSIVASSEHDMKITTKNARIELAEGGDKSTGGMIYKFTPIDIGECGIWVGLILDEKRQTSLLYKFFDVIEYTTPPIHLNENITGSIIKQIDDSIELKCHYLPSTGVFDEYTIIKWKVKYDNQEYIGNGSFLSKELMEILSKSNSKSVLQIEVELENNKTGFTKSEGIYIIDLEEKKKGK